MIDPFTAWLRMATVASDMSRTGLRTLEMLSASGDVIDKRSGMMRDAATTPFGAHHAELARMMPEKVEAFSRAGSAMATDWWAMQSAWMAEAQNLGTMMLRGRAPTLAEASALASRTQAHGLRFIERAAGMSAAGLAPIHKQATSNARRLKRKK